MVICLKDFVRKCNSMIELVKCIQESIQKSEDMNLLIEEFYEGLIRVKIGN
jgi:hypothetical protein